MFSLMRGFASLYNTGNNFGAENTETYVYYCFPPAPHAFNLYFFFKIRKQ